MEKNIYTVVQSVADRIFILVDVTDIHSTNGDAQQLLEYTDENGRLINANAINNFELCTNDEYCFYVAFLIDCAKNARLLQKENNKVFYSFPINIHKQEGFL